MEKATNKNLYQEVSDRADTIYKRPGLYKSAYIQKEYQKQGGKYKGDKPDKTKGIQRWLLNEQWIEVTQYLKDNKKVKCGTSEKSGKACRPLIRVNKNTPITIPELLKLHSKEKLLKLIKQKEKVMDGRIQWKKGTFKPSM